MTKSFRMLVLSVLGLVAATAARAEQFTVALFTKTAGWHHESILQGVEAVRRIREAPARPVADALLDQRNLAGIGNLYKSELCFLAGVHPWRPVADVPTLDRMVRRAH